MSGEQKGSFQSKSEDVVNRPIYLQRLAEFIGQDKIKASLTDLIAAARQRNEPLDHLLFYGLTGIGKTTIARILANEMGVDIKVVSGSTIEKAGEWAQVLTNLHAGDIILIQQIETIRKSVGEILIPAMKDFVLDLVIGKGPSARSITLKLPHFTVFGTTNKLSQVDERLRNIMFEFNFALYNAKDISEILLRLAKTQGISIDLDAANLLAEYCNGLPAQAITILKRVHKSAQVYENGKITLIVSKYALAGLDHNETNTSRERQPIPDEVKRFVWQRDKGRCIICGSQEKLEFDHIIPISEGGSNTARNIQLLCEKHNRAKGAKIG